MAPSNLSYPAEPVFVVGKPISPLIPTISGQVSSYSVSPALPGGLILDVATGSISGTPEALVASASYTVTARNTAGQTTASLTLAVESGMLFDLGHDDAIILTRLTPTRLLSVDATKHWVLWDYTSGAHLADGAASCPSSNCSPGGGTPAYDADLAEPTLVVQTASSLEIRASSNGGLIASIAATPAWWKLAVDGSYVAGGSNTALTIWSSAGAVIASVPGDYSKAQAFAATGELRLAMSPAGSNVVQTIAVPSATTSTGPAFLGQFYAWFQDGERFLTVVSNTVRTYSKSSSQQDITALSSIENLTGQGNWFWTYQASIPGYPLQIYKVGASTSAAASYSLSVDTALIPSGSNIGVLLSEVAQSSVIDLSGSTPVKTDYSLPVPYNSAYAASSTRWVVGNGHGVLVDGASLAGTPRYFGFGHAWSIAGSNQQIAVATASGSILYFNSATKAQEGIIPFSSTKVLLSSDGSVLLAAGDSQDSQYHPDLSIKAFSLPSASQTRNWPYTFGTYPTPFDISLSANGNVVGLVLGTFSGQWNFNRQALQLAGGAPFWMDSETSTSPLGFQPIRLSPDGSLIAVSNSRDANAGTNIYTNGVLTSAAPGWAVGWLDGSRLLTNQYTTNIVGSPQFSGATIYDSSGAKLAAPPLPELSTVQAVGANAVYDQGSNTIYSLPDAKPTWTTPSPSRGVGAIAGSRVIFVSGAQVRAEPY